MVSSHIFAHISHRFFFPLFWSQRVHNCDSSFCPIFIMLWKTTVVGPTPLAARWGRLEIQFGSGPAELRRSPADRLTHPRFFWSCSTIERRSKSKSELVVAVRLRRSGISVSLRIDSHEGNLTFHIWFNEKFQRSLVRYYCLKGKVSEADGGQGEDLPGCLKETKGRDRKKGWKVRTAVGTPDLDLGARIAGELQDDQGGGRSQEGGVWWWDTYSLFF